MLTRRIIACLDVDAGRVVKGTRFVEIKDAGDPAALAAAHAEHGADEIVLLDITATHESRATLFDTVRRAARQLFIPFTVGGGIRSLDDACAVFDAGADKIAINSAAIRTPDLIGDIAHRFGSQAVIVSVDAKKIVGGPPLSLPVLERQGGTAYEVFVRGGRENTGRNVFEWVREAEQRGAGEILLTSIDRDGTRSGFDCPLTASVAALVSIPVIASGGAGSAQHFVDVFRDGCADAALAAGIFHFGVHDIGQLKREVAAAGIPMRWPC